MKPLTKKQRSLSLIILGIIFIFVAPVIVAYSLGYTLDDNYTFQKTGGVFIHSNVANVSVYVDKKFLKVNGAFFRNVLIQDLVPNKKYTIEVSKDNYQSWKKEIYVYPSVVSEGSVLMLPKTFDVREVLKYVDKNGVATTTPLYKNQTKPSNPEFIIVTELFASSTKTTAQKTEASTSSTATSALSILKQKSKIEVFFDNLNISHFEKLKNNIVNGEEVSWIDTGNINLYWMGDLISSPYYYCGGEKERTCDNHISLDLKDEIKRFDYLPGRNDVWLVLTSHGIYAAEVDGRTERNIQTIYLGENLDFRLTQSDRLIIKEGSKFFEINL